MNLKFAATFIASLALPAVSFGLGFRIADQNTEATARGNAFTATADNPSAVYYNPAGLTTFDGLRTLLGAYSITIHERVSLQAPGRNNDFSSTNTDFQTVPTFFVSYKAPQSPVAFGLGVYVPFGFSLEYADDTPIRTLAKEGMIQCLTLNPVVAVQICKGLSVAAGGTVNYGEAKLARGIFAEGDEFRFEGDGLSYGFNLGLMWQPHPMHRFGLTYRSTTEIDFSGYTSVHTNPFTVTTPFGPFTVPGIDTVEDADGKIRLPQVIVFGYSFRPTPDWNFEFNLDWTDWDSLNTVTIHQQTSADIAVPFNWESSFFYEFGVTKNFSHGLAASLGYLYSENSVPEESFNPNIPDSNRHVFSAGISQRLEHFNWALAYQYSHGPRREIRQGTAADGSYRAEAHAVTLSFGYDF